MNAAVVENSVAVDVAAVVAVVVGVVVGADVAAAVAVDGAGEEIRGFLKHYFRRNGGLAKGRIPFLGKRRKCLHCSDEPFREDLLLADPGLGSKSRTAAPRNQRMLRVDESYCATAFAATMGGADVEKQKHEYC